jgi:Ca-activated chloride channel family protein
MGALIDFRGLRYLHASDAWLAALALVAIAVVLLLLRSTVLRRSARHRVAVPAILGAIDRPSWSFIRHAPTVLFVAGIPFALIALADPITLLTQQEETYPGRRICLMIDASSSMTRPFGSLPGGGGRQATFFSTVEAAERFVEMRASGKYRDLMALVEFGDQAYVVTPFTTDYDNIRLSLSLVGDASEFARFPDQGTLMSRAVDQGVSLFEAFDFLDAAGNVMVLFSDGEDAGVVRKEITLADVVKAAREAEVPIYFVRTRAGQTLGSVVSDLEWKKAVEDTGGRFYAASDSGTLLEAVRDIDRASAGQISILRYATETRRFATFAAAAAGSWSIALLLMLAVPYFRRFP